MKLKRIKVMYILFFLSIIFYFNNSTYASLRWSFLNEGDSIEVFASGYGAKDGSIETAKSNIARFQLQPSVPDDFIIPQPLGYANTEIYRANHIKDIIESDKKVAWALRGGRGSSTILPYLSKLKPSQSPKIFVGYSDITALHLYTARWGWPFLHSIVLAYNKDANPDVVNKEATINDVIDILTGKVQELRYGLTPMMIV
jgi:muramoyltetrapeptide carboxypeptidase